jgi:hypothetical protein
MLYYVPLRSSMGCLHFNSLNSKLFSVGDYSYYKNNKNAYVNNMNKKESQLELSLKSKQLENFMYIQLFVILILKYLLNKNITNNKLIKYNRNFYLYFINFVTKILKKNNLKLSSSLLNKLFMNIKVLFTNLFTDSSFFNSKGCNFFILKSKLISKTNLWMYFYLLRYNYLSWNSGFHIEKKFSLGQFNFFDLSKIKFWDWNFLIYNQRNLFFLLINQNQRNLLLNKLKFQNLIYLYFLQLLINNLDKKNLINMTANLSLSLRMKRQIKNFLIWN